MKMRRNNRGNTNDIDMELAMIKRRRQMIQEQRQMLEESEQLECLQGQAGNWQQNMRYNNIQQPYNQFNDGNAFNQYPSVYDNNSNGYQRPDDYQSTVWQSNAAPKPQMYGNSGFNDRDYQMTGPQQLMTPGNDSRSVFNRNVNRFSGPQRQQPRFANATKPIGVKSKTQFVQGRVTKPKIVVNPLNKSKFPKKTGPGHAGPVWEGHVGVRGPLQVAPVALDNTYLLRTRNTTNPKLHGRLELCLGEILREVRANVEKSGLDIKLTVPLVKTIKEYIRNRIRKAMVGKHAHTVSYVLNLYRARHPSTKDVMFVKNLKDTAQKEAAAKLGVDTVSTPASKSLAKDSVKQKPVRAANKTDGNAESNPQDEEANEWLTHKINIQKITHDQLNKLLLKLNDLVKAEAKDEGEEEEGKADESQTEEDKKTEGEAEGVTGQEGEGMEVEKKEEESASPKDEKMDRLERLIEQKLPFILPRFKNLMLAILNSEPLPTSHTGKIRLYMVKLFGRPTLPKRHLLAHFLMPYNVLNIKKLRTRGNLLIIGCATEEDRDRLLAASGSNIGNIKLHIKICQDTPIRTKGDTATLNSEKDTATTNSEEKDVTVDEEAGNEQNDTVDLCDENGDTPNDPEVSEDQTGQAESEVIDLDEQEDDNVEKTEEVEAETEKLNPGQEIKKEAVGTPSKAITTRRSSRFPK